MVKRSEGGVRLKSGRFIHPFVWFGYLVYSVDMKSGCPNIVIKYSPEIDVSVVKSTLGYAEWYIEHGYKPQLPNGISINEVKEGSEEAIFSQAENGYNEHFYKNVAASITEQWKKYVENWPSEKVAKMGLGFASEYTVCLTSYGVGATYNESEGTLMLNVCNADTLELVSTIFHELIHIVIEPNIQKHDIGHWQKERLVDLIFKQLLPDFSFEQKLPDEAYKMDSFFEKYSGEVEKVIESFSQR